MARSRTPGSFARRRASARRAIQAVSLTMGHDGQYQSSSCEQMALFEAPGPTLVVTVEAPDMLDGALGNDAAPALAELGAVLASVLDFHKAFDLPREPSPTARVGDALAQLRVRLLREEVDEFEDAVNKHDLVAIADALADVVYVAYGSAITYGIDLDAVIREVHRANMSKLDHAGKPLMRDDGKVLKSSRYRPPDIAAVIEAQLDLFDPGEYAVTGVSSAS